MSEAIRILLPVSIISDSERRLQSFIASIQLGLKKRFKGKIDHLQTTVHEEPIADSAFKRKYLVLYDTVPGGTGYLKQLMRSEHELMGVLELALEALKSCSCNQDENKDGCYRCLYAYRNSYNMKETSRNTAIELLAEIISYKDRLIKTGNIRDISMNTYIESELEARFIGALKKEGSKSLPIQLKNDLVNGKPGYFLKVDDKAYYIEPQVALGKLSGVSIESRADFVIRSARLHDAMKPIVVFLDGFTYHRDRIGKDMAQRMAIVQSNKFHVWSLTWQDVEDKYKPQGDYFIDFLDPAGFASGGNFNELMDGFKVGSFKKLVKYNSFDLLIRFLENPDEDTWRKLMFVVSLLHTDHSRFNTTETDAQWIAEVEAIFPEEIADNVKEVHCPCLFGEYEPASHDGYRPVKQMVAIEQAAVAPPGTPLGAKIGCCLSDQEEDKKKSIFQAAWNGFLRLYNFYQFLPYSYFVTKDGLANKVYDGLKLYEEPVFRGEEQEAEPDEKAWSEVIELTGEELHGLLDELKKNGWPLPEAGFELEGSEGGVIGSAELAWEGLKLAFLTEVELEYQQHFHDVGWRTIPLQEVLGSPVNYMNLKDYKGE
jgi:DEAD/DEAH box helicase domain-containing protein